MVYRAPQQKRAAVPFALIAARLQAGKLVALLKDKHRYDINAIWRQTRHRGSKVRVTIDELVANVPRLIESARPV